ncbi:hypothetical protein GNP94_21275 [Paenibacillus campinasensis]|uniref:Uncharacterized protein n=1 Tax=Paenibacillus campinasensis TaxID=66347 RepID=A0ABW9T8R0_9BACL|nr:hypothetical protein [Paenibacillus campinasensis]MUG68510.1 hypothetical protein [Paenibacillus campinasensis]
MKKFKQTFLLMLTLVMCFSTSVFAAENEMARKPGKAVEIDFSLEARNVNVLHLGEGKLESYDEHGIKTTSYLTAAEVKAKVAEVGTMSYDTGNLNINVPRNIDGNQGRTVGSYNVVAPHTYVNLQVITLPQTTMPTINVAFTNAWGDDTGWIANVPQNSLVYMRASYPDEPYVARVSTNELYSAIATVRSFSSY